MIDPNNWTSDTNLNELVTITIENYLRNITKHMVITEEIDLL